MQKTKNKKIKRLKLLTEEFEMPVPLEELAVYIIGEEKATSRIKKLLASKPDKINHVVKTMLLDMIEIKDWKIDVESVKFDYCDSQDVTFGIAYFKVMFQGTRQALKQLGRSDWPLTKKAE
jgi:hypothetical protein